MTHHPVSLDHVRYLVSTPVAAPPLPTPVLQLVHLRAVAARALLQHYITGAFIKRIKNSDATRLWVYLSRGGSFNSGPSEGIVLQVSLSNHFSALSGLFELDVQFLMPQPQI